MDRCSSSGASWLLVTAELPIRLLLLLVSTLQPAADKTNVQNNLPLTLPSPALLLPSICCTCLPVSQYTNKESLPVSLARLQLVVVQAGLWTGSSWQRVPRWDEEAEAAVEPSCKTGRQLTAAKPHCTIPLS